MRRIVLCLPLLLWMLVAFGCAPSVPKWYTELPKDPEYMFAAKIGQSQSPQMAVDKAVTDARAEIARQTEVWVSTYQKKFDEEVGLSKDSELLQHFIQATKTVASASLVGSQIRYQALHKESSGHTAYVLVEYPIGAAAEALSVQINKDNVMYTRFRASEGYKNLEEEVQKYEDWKAKQKEAK